jgi:hypothetical protein
VTVIKVIASRRVRVLLGAILLASTLSGCGALILAHQDSVGLDGLASANVTLGLPRETVEAALGKPETSRPLPDGSRVDTYAYTERNPEWQRRKVEFALMSMMTVGFAEPILVPWAGYEVLKNRRTVTLTFGADERLLAYSPPPPYGPPDDSIEPLSFDQIRKRCRHEHGAGRTGVSSDAPLPVPRPYAYGECLVRRLAIWGIE